MRRHRISTGLVKLIRVSGLDTCGGAVGKRITKLLDVGSENM